jgi:site-specific recombinase XerD
MKVFESFLANYLEEYIAYRKSLGFADKTLRARLAKFDSYAKDFASRADDLTPSFFLQWRNQLSGNPKTLNQVLCALRGLLQFLVRRTYLDDNPAKDIPGFAEYAYIPFIFSIAQTDKLLTSIESNIRRHPAYFLQDLATYVAMVLLARCGLRLSEPLRLKCSDYRKQENTIYIEKTKFNKDRLIPVPDSVAGCIHNYLRVRQTLCPDTVTDALLISGNGQPISERQVYAAFHTAVDHIGICCPKKIIANTVFANPTPHSLRHSFAVNTLVRVKERGQSPQYALPVLSAYMGHSKYRYTAVYLKVVDAKHRQALVDFSISKQNEI